MPNRKQLSPDLFKLSVVFILISALLNMAPGLNLEKFGTHDPEFFVHSLDVAFVNDLALVTGYGGLMIYDISGANVRYLNRYNYGNGRGAAIYNSIGSGDYAYATARMDGLFIVNIAQPDRPSLVTRRPFADLTLEGLTYRNEVLVVAAHEAGLFFINVTDPANPELLFQLAGLTNAWDVLFLNDSTLGVADGDGGLAVVEFDGEAAQIINQTETSGSAIELKSNGDFCAVAVGADGVDYFDLSDLDAPVLRSNFNTPTYAGHIGLDGDQVAVADWNEVLVIDFADPGQPVLNGRKPTEARAMGVEMRDSKVYLADWAVFTGYHYGQIEGADIALSTRRITPAGEGLIDTSVTVFNHGLELLQVSSVRCNAQEFQSEINQFDVEPGDSLRFPFSYLPTVENQTNYLRFNSNDTDENSAQVDLERVGTLSVGDRAPDFGAPLLGGGRYQLSDMLGRVQLLIFWASW